VLLPRHWQAYARYLSLSRKPILCGPFRSEVGFECLYWIPFLHHFMHAYKIPKERMIAIGRGGSASWYGFAGSADLYEHVPVDVARTWSIQENHATGSIKQQRVEPWEQHVCGLTAHALGLPKYHTLSPSWMYGLLAPFWTGQKSLKWLNSQTLQMAKMPAPAMSAELKSKLPKDFIAMRWYVRATWPYGDAQVLWMRTFTERIAKKAPVVLIDSFHADDHADVNLGPLDNVVRLSELTPMTPLDNLAVQSSVIAQAKAYIGTYGGMSQAAMRWGVPTLALYQEFGQTAPEHLQLTQHLSLRTGVPFIACTPKQVDGALPMLVGRA
jgi:hypothetical protein